MATITQTQRVSDTLTAAVRAIEVRGWDLLGDHRDPCPSGRVTLVGAIAAATGLHPGELADGPHPAVAELVRHLDLPGGPYSVGSLAGWGEAVSSWEAAAVLRSVAAIAREEGR